jgi:hypothetical protein
MQREFLIENSKTYFRPWEAIFEANPQFILERGERCELPPMFHPAGWARRQCHPRDQSAFRGHL